MTRTKLLATLVTTIVMGTSFSEAKADLPSDRTIKFYVRETPSDPQSDIIWSVELDLTAADLKVESVGWRISALRVKDHDSSYSPLRSWTMTLPLVDTPDGLWWVDHAAHMNPLTDEFEVTPLLKGTAIAAQQGGADLAYSFEGDAYTGNPMYGGKVSGLTFSFMLAGAVLPEETGDDEPGEIDEENEPPIGASSGVAGRSTALTHPVACGRGGQRRAEDQRSALFHRRSVEWCMRSRVFRSARLQHRRLQDAVERTQSLPDAPADRIARASVVGRPDILEPDSHRS